MIDEKKLIEDIHWNVREQNVISEEVGHNRPFCDKANVIKCINDQPKIGEWIPCSERLPEDSKTEIYDMQLVTLDNGDVCLGVYRHDDKEWFTRMSEEETIYSNNHKVIAWQPLPEPYKEK